ncbi:MAG: hypothetical protein LBV55_03765, partial [Acholeplasmatales bacterium]|nr:hypothetical protein [Acholeplasmatales bacterium]
YDYYDPFTTLSAQLIADLVAYGFTVSTGSGNNVTYSITEGGYVITFHLVYNINSTGSYFEVKVTPAA